MKWDDSKPAILGSSAALGFVHRQKMRAAMDRQFSAIDPRTRPQHLPVYVINLTSSTDRRASITSQLGAHGIDFTFVEAVDGRELDMTDPEVIASISEDTTALRPTVAACAMSHLNAYCQMIAEGSDAALVMEDDVQVPADLEVLAAEVATKLSGAEVALLNFESPQPVTFTRQEGVTLSCGRRLLSPTDVRQPVSGAAYVITREACERISQGQRPIRVKSDDWAHYYDEGMLDMLRCVVPMPVAKDPRFESTMGYNRDGGLKARLLGVITRYGPNFLQTVVARRRQRKWRVYNRVVFLDEPLEG
jgi:glycosyl transferase, family 25